MDERVFAQQVPQAHPECKEAQNKMHQVQPIKRKYNLHKMRLLFHHYTIGGWKHKDENKLPIGIF